MPYKDPARRKQFNADYYQQNAGVIARRAADHHANNLDRNLARMKKRWKEMTPAQREAERERIRKWTKDNPGNRKSARLKWKYGITLSERAAMAAAQGYRCAICGISEADATRGTLAIDHDHQTGALRGLLCDNCNKALGCFKDSQASLAKAIEYLSRSSAP